jgi:hypothetical protein
MVTPFREGDIDGPTQRFVEPVKRCPDSVVPVALDILLQQRGGNPWIMRLIVACLT